MCRDEDLEFRLLDGIIVELDQVPLDNVIVVASENTTDEIYWISVV